MNEPTAPNIWFCEQCHAVEATTVAAEDRDLRSVLYAIERAHRRISPQCEQPVGCLRVINRRLVKSRADLEADASVPRWVIDPVLHLLDAASGEERQRSPGTVQAKHSRKEA